MSGDLRKHDFPRVKEEVFKKTLANGLQVVLIPKPDYHEFFAMAVTKFGAMDTVFKPNNRKRHQVFPAGIAHFLEHCLFEMKDGEDALQVLSHLGAQANAFTTYTQTAYYFSCTTRVLESLEVLQQFTTLSRFSEKSLLKEKEIIKQEIRMYQDDPDYQLRRSILAQLYPETPLADDIAGSLESITPIDRTLLEKAFDVFYQPSNMLLLLVGNFDPKESLEAIENYQNRGRIKKRRVIDKTPLKHLPVRSSANLDMLVSGPKLAVGLRGQLTLTNWPTKTYRLALRLLFSMILGWTSSTYQKWYQKGKIDDSFAIEIEVSEAYRFALITLDTTEPLAMSKRIRQLIKNFEQLEDLTEEHFELVKKEMYGDFMASMNHLESMAVEYASSWGEDEDVFSLPEIIDNLALTDVLKIGRDFILEADTTDFIIFPR